MRQCEPARQFNMHNSVSFEFGRELENKASVAARPAVVVAGTQGAMSMMQGVQGVVMIMSQVSMLLEQQHMALSNSFFT